MQFGVKHSLPSSPFPTCGSRKHTLSLGGWSYFIISVVCGLGLQSLLGHVSSWGILHLSQRHLQQCHPFLQWVFVTSRAPLGSQKRICWWLKRNVPNKNLQAQFLWFLLLLFYRTTDEVAKGRMLLIIIIQGLERLKFMSFPPDRSYF